ncbi:MULTISPECIES: DUF5685 family protein [unclassified Marinitoga]|uniref:DUF5685 family protein n=1 Tax=unclassified Marinitoga TaxID=2640159 RepID=UPI000641719F|nr:MULTISPECIES: DUF5685 family protein [unclassified Marinitoga]KLO25176.1 hypothetical protein X274_00865 [Marinitoga sp. 1155]NUU98640.1 hypothetical protein [Marinitoga sp. 1154]
MYGYISLYFKPTKIERLNYISHYCSICHSLKRNFGNFYRMFIIREVSFFSLLKVEFNEKNIEEITCPWVGFKKRYIYKNIEIFDEFSFLNALIIYGKIYDKLHDSNLNKLVVFIKFLKRKLIYYYGKDFIETYENILNEQFKIENKTLEFEEYFIPSIKIIQMILNKHQIFFSDDFSTYIGTLIYLFDAIYDLEKDIKKKNFNPFKRVFHIDKLNVLDKENKEFINFIIDYSIKNILDILETSNIKNKHFAKKLFSFSASYHKSKIEKLFYSNNKMPEKNISHINSKNIYLNIK